MKTITEETDTAPATEADLAPNPNKKATRAPRRAPVTPAKGKAGKKASPAKKAPKGRTKAKALKPKARDGSKTAKILDLLKRPGGVTAKELMKATGWQPHSVRGFLSGTVRTKMGLTVKSVKAESGDRVADDLLSVIRGAQAAGLTRTELINHFGRNMPADRIGRALGVLANHDLIRRDVDAGTGGRSAERWTAVRY